MKLDWYRLGASLRIALIGILGIIGGLTGILGLFTLPFLLLAPLYAGLLDIFLVMTGIVTAVVYHDDLTFPKKS